MALCHFLLGNERTSYAHVAGKRMQMAATRKLAQSHPVLAHDQAFWQAFDALEVRLNALDITALGMQAQGCPATASVSANMPAEAAAKATADYMGTRAQTIYGGANEIQKNIIAKRVLGL